MDRRALLLALPLAVGCTVQAPTVALNAVCAAPSDATNCAYSATCSAQYIGTITVDTSQTAQLFLAVEASNQSPRNSDTTAGRTNTAEAYLQEVRITYSGPLALPAASHRLIQHIPANGTAVVAFPVMDVTAATLPGGVAQATVIAKVKARGIFGDGTDFESPEYEIPVNVCNGCIGAPPTCAAGESLFVCPGNWGQAPGSFTCAG